MAMNPKQFDGGTPYDYAEPIDTSGPSTELKHNATRLWRGATPFTHSKPTKKSGGDGIGNPPGMAGKRNSGDHNSATPFNHFQPTPHSLPQGPPVEPKKWTKKKYAMTSPS